MINEEFYILHLSDLHIRNDCENRNGNEFYSFALTRLLSDIEEQTKNKEKLIVVISGDIIDQGNYDKHKAAAVKFFTDMYKRIGRKVSDIIIVPGNHDKCRNRINSLISMSHSREGLSAETAQLEWDVQLQAYKEYLALVNQIYSIFGKKDVVTNTFGVNTITVTDTKICFISVDTAWCSYSKDDRRKLRIGKYQLNQLSQTYKAVKSQSEAEKAPIGLTIAVSHYPLNWLCPDEEELCNKYFLSEDHLNVDILMCGHVHDFSVVNSFNHKHSLLTLVTGIGWGSSEPDDGKENHRYSLYTVSLSHNSCDIVMRKTKNNGKFDYDYSAYVGEQELRDGKLRYPFRMREGNPFIRINAPKSVEAKSLFVDNSLIQFIPKVVNAMTSFTKNIASLYAMYRENFMQKIKERIGEDSADYEIITDYFYHDKEMPSNLKEKYFNVDSTLPDFLAFLREICTETVCSLEECFSPNTFLRAHFRWHNFTASRRKITNDNYKMLCQDSNLPGDQQKDSMQVVDWGGLIEHAFLTGEPLVYSANKRYNPINTSWDDFITMIPKFTDYAHDVRTPQGHPTSRPIMTFALSIKRASKKEDTIALLLLAYLRYDELLAKVIDEYMQMFMIDAKNFLPHIKRIKK